MQNSYHIFYIIQQLDSHLEAINQIKFFWTGNSLN